MLSGARLPFGKAEPLPIEQVSENGKSRDNAANRRPDEHPQLGEALVLFVEHHLALAGDAARARRIRRIQIDQVVGTLDRRVHREYIDARVLQRVDVTVADGGRVARVTVVIIRRLHAQFGRLRKL